MTGLTTTIIAFKYLGINNKTNLYLIMSGCLITIVKKNKNNIDQEYIST